MTSLSIPSRPARGPTSGRPCGTESAAYMKPLARFVMSEGAKYRDLEPASDSLSPRKADGSRDAGLDGWSYMMRTAAKDFALLYFENQAHRARAAGWNPNVALQLRWFNTQTGEWQAGATLRADANGGIATPAISRRVDVADTDWAAKITAQKGAN